MANLTEELTRETIERQFETLTPAEVERLAILARKCKESGRWEPFKWLAEEIVGEHSQQSRSRLRAQIWAEIEPLGPGKPSGRRDGRQKG